MRLRHSLSLLMMTFVGSASASTGWVDIFGWHRVRDVADVAARFVGTMDSADQAIAHRDYGDLRLTQCSVRVQGLVPSQALTSRFVYMEQASSLEVNSPFHQRFFKISPSRTDEKTVVSSIYEPGVPLSELRGFCSRPAWQRVVTAEMLGTSNCALYLHRSGDAWRGSTPAEGCATSQGEAVRFTSNVTLFRSGMLSWDRGFDSEGRQVWGALSGGYEFLRIDPSTRQVHVNAVAARLSGNFTNEEQVQLAPQDFTHVDYSMCPVTIAGMALPVGARAQFAEQRVVIPGRTAKRFALYLVLAGDAPGEVLVQTASLKDTTNLVGFCRRPQAERVLVSTNVLPTDCTIDYHRVASRDVYVGEGVCPSTYNGAVRLNLSEELYPNKLMVWERWYDAQGNQVAGSKVGPYIYKLQ